MIVEAINIRRAVQLDLAIPLAVSSGMQVLPGQTQKPFVSEVQSMLPSSSRGYALTL